MMPMLIEADWNAPGHIIAGTTTRHGDDVLPKKPVFLKQVHGDQVVELDALQAAREPVEADAVVASEEGAIVAVRTADCVPVLLCCRRGERIAAVHAGWRGIAAGVIENAVASMRVPCADLLAWLGPAISQPAFEVGDEVRQAFLESGPESAGYFLPNERGRWQADLYGLVRMRLEGAGVTNVRGGRRCTYSEPSLFYSYRRSSDTGRMISFVYRGSSGDGATRIEPRGSGFEPRL